MLGRQRFKMNVNRYVSFELGSFTIWLQLYFRQCSYEKLFPKILLKKWDLHKSNGEP